MALAGEAVAEASGTGSGLARALRVRKGWRLRWAIPTALGFPRTKAGSFMLLSSLAGSLSFAPTVCYSMRFDDESNSLKL